MSSQTAYPCILDMDNTLVPTAVETLVQAFGAAGGQHYQVFGWCVDGATGELTGRLP